MSNESLINNGSFWFPGLAEESVRGVDFLFWGVFWVSVAMFIGIMGVVVYFNVKFRRTPQNEKAVGHVTHNNVLEAVWIVIPLILVIILFVWGFVDYMKFSIPPANAYEVKVIGKKWFWQFEYPNGTSSVNDLVVPEKTPILLNMTSEDVLHSFFLPNFRRKKDMIPNRYTSIWFNSDRTGNFQIFCAEYCGDQHSVMLGSLKVVTKAEFEVWLKNANSGSDLPPEKLGEKLYQSKACFTCHSLDGSPKPGSTWKGLYGAKIPLASGQTVTVDDNYLRDAIVVPAKEVRQRFPAIMPSYQGLLNEKEIAGIIAFIKTIK